MKRLPPDLYLNVVPRIQESGMRGHLALVYEIIDGRVPGRVFVDQIENPHTALVCNFNGFYFCFGVPAIDQVGPQIKSLWEENRSDVFTSLFGSNASWDTVLAEILTPLGAEPITRIGFEQEYSPPFVSLPDGYAIEQIDAHLAQSILDGSGTHHFGIDPWFIKVAGGPTAYARNELGLAVIYQGQIASICGICGMARGEVEMEVGTVPLFAGKGLATTVSAAFMRQCQEKGLVPAYSCASDNQASRAVAKKLGYIEIEEIRGYPLYVIPEG